MGSSKQKRPSMKDVADLAGVSRTTVSFVLNDREGTNIPQPTQQRVMDAVNQLGYRPNAIAQGLRGQRTKTLGFISDEIGTTPYAGQILQGAQDLAWEHGILLFSVNTNRNQDLKKTAINQLLDRRVDGIIYAAMYHRPVDPPANLREVPSVLLDCFVEDLSLPSVVPDDFAGGLEATEHLIKNGHRKIALIHDNIDGVAKRMRLDGYRLALQNAGIEFDEQLVTEGSSDQAGGYEAVEVLLGRDNPFTALFCFNDRMAMGAYAALNQHGLTIPDDISVIGYDNQTLIAPHLRPPLTTMQLPHYEMGQWAVRHLLTLIKAETESPMPIQKNMPCPLIERLSVKPLA